MLYISGPSITHSRKKILPNITKYYSSNHYSTYSTFFHSLLSVCSFTVCLCSSLAIVLHVFLILEYCRVRINFSKLYREKLYGKNLLVSVLPEGLLWLSLMGRKICNFAYCRLLENAISNKNHGTSGFNTWRTSRTCIRLLL